MEFKLLGPVQARTADGPIDLGPRKERFVLAVLALEVNRAVSVARLVELTWPESPPRTAEHAIRVFVSHLRTVLAAVPGGETGIERHGSGYLLRCAPERVDAHRFRSLLRAARGQSDDRRAVELLDTALGLWAGPALDGCAPPEVRDLLCAGLEEAQLTAVEDRLDARLRLGQHRILLDELTSLVGRHPLRDRLVGQLMLALYRDGRAADALAVYRAARERWSTQLGLDPGPALRRLQTAILRADPALALPSAGLPSAGLPSAGLPSAGLPSAGLPSAGLPSAHRPVAAQPDAAGARAVRPDAAAEPTRRLRVLLVDDHPMFRAGMRLALETDPHISVIAEAGDVAAAVWLTGECSPDVVVMDLHLPDQSGVDGTRLLRQQRPDLPILVMTMSGADDHIVDALRAGARGYILKSAGRDEVLHAIRSVLQGTAVFSADIAARLATLAASRPQAHPPH